MHSAPGAGLALVTVAHNSEADLERLLGSVSAHLPGAGMVVADCGSSDASLTVARAWPGRATVLELGENAGFGRGSNAGVALVDEPVTVLVNPDVELLDASLAALAAELARPGSEDRLLAPVVLRPDGGRQDSALHAPASAAALVFALVPPGALPRPLAVAIEPWRARVPRRAAWAVGCCLAGRTSTLRRLGPFDERIFLYGEDLELCLRAAGQGVETWFWPPARVLHRRAHSTRPAFGEEPFELLARQRRAVVAERRGHGRARIDDWLLLLTYADRLLLKRLLRRPAERERRQLRALWQVRREPFALEP